MHYVDGKNNPADDASCGLSPKDVLQSSGWLQEPSFLWEHRGNWRDFNKTAPEPLQLDDKEVKKASSSATSVSNNEEPATLLQCLESFSSWLRAKCAVAVCLQYLRILLNQVRGNQMTTEGVKTRSAACKYNSVNVEELNAAEQEIIRHLQKEAFKEEISKLKNPTTRGEAKGSSPLFRLDPFLDLNDLVRIGGRIRQASLSQDAKHPVVLPGQGHITKILASHYHEKALHQGKGIKGQANTHLSFYILWSGLFWPLVRERRTQGTQAVWSPIHMCSHKSDSPRSSQLFGNGLVH